MSPTLSKTRTATLLQILQTGPYPFVLFNLIDVSPSLRTSIRGCSGRTECRLSRWRLGRRGCRPRRECRRGTGRPRALASSIRARQRCPQSLLYSVVPSRDEALAAPHHLRTAGAAITIKMSTVTTINPRLIGRVTNTARDRRARPAMCGAGLLPPSARARDRASRAISQSWAYLSKGLSEAALKPTIRPRPRHSARFPPLWYKRPHIEPISPAL